MEIAAAVMACPFDEALGFACAVRAEACQFELCIGQDFVRRVVNDDGTVQVCKRRFCAVLFPYESFPALGVHGFSFSPGFPEIDAADRAAVLGYDIVFANEAGNALILRRRTQKNTSCFGPRDGLWQVVRGDNCNHVDTPSEGRLASARTRARLNKFL